MYNLTLDKLMWRYYFMMAIVIGSFYIGIPWLAILSVPVLLSALAGWSFPKKTKKSVTQESKTAATNLSTQF